MKKVVILTLFIIIAFASFEEAIADIFPIQVKGTLSISSPSPYNVGVEYKNPNLASARLVRSIYQNNSFRSALLPGWGQWSQGRKRAGISFFLIEVFIGSAMIAAHNEWGIYTNDPKQRWVTGVLCAMHLINVYDAYLYDCFNR